MPQWVLSGSTTLHCFLIVGCWLSFSYFLALRSALIYQVSVEENAKTNVIFFKDKNVYT